MKKILRVVIYLFVMQCFMVSCAKPKADENGYIVYDGDMAPDFFIRLTDDTCIRLSDLRGKVVMLQFTASWCGVCRKEMPYIEHDIWQKYGSRSDFMLIGIDRDEPLETVLSFAESTGVTYPMGLDPNADIFSLYALKEAGVTRNVLIDRQGVIIMRTRLYNHEEFEGLVREIDRQMNLK